MELREWQKKIHENAVAHGWHDKPRSDGEIIALVHSELSEALEEIRNHRAFTEIYFEPDKEGIPKPEGAAVELVDAVIRILDALALKKVDAEEVLELKHRYNLTRPYRHGGKAL